MALKDSLRSLFKSGQKSRTRHRDRMRLATRRLTFEQNEPRLLMAVTALPDSGYTLAHSKPSTANTLNVAAMQGVLVNDSGGTLTAHLSSGPTHASSFTLNADGGFSYTPEANFAGIDTFTYYAKNTTNETSGVVAATVSVTNTAPHAQGDTFVGNQTISSSKNTTVKLPAPGLLMGDTDPDGDQIFVTRIIDSPHGKVEPNPDGSFHFTPEPGFIGTASFLYEISDGMSTAQAWSAVLVNDFQAQSTFNADNSVACCVTCGCNMEAKVQEQSGKVYADQNSTALRHSTGSSIIAGDADLASSASTPTSIIATIDYRGERSATVNYDPSTLPTDGEIQLNFAVNSLTVPTGRHPYTVNVTRDYALGQSTTEHFVNWQLHLNPSDSPFGNGWSPFYFERLHMDLGGIILQKGDGNLWWFPELDDGTYGYEDVNYEDGKRRFSLGDLTFSQLEVDGTGYKVTDKYGTISYFNSIGAMTSRADRNGNVETFTYTDKDSDGAADEVVSMTDAAGRTTTFTYSGPRVSKITDFANRDTTFTYTGDKLTQILQSDPDGAGPLLSPKTTFTYDASGNLTSYVQPDNKTTSFEYNWAGMMVKRTNANNTTVEVTPTWLAALPDVNSGIGTSTNPAPIIPAGAAIGSIKNELGNVTEFKVDRFGNRTWIKDPAPFNYETNIKRDDNGQITELAEPDPDAAGPLPAHLTKFEYDAVGNLLEMTLPSNDTRTWTYGVFSQVSSFTDADGQTTLYDLDPANGNVLAIQEVIGTAGTVSSPGDDLMTEFTYTSTGIRGLVDTVTDPLGRVTNFDSNTHGLPTQITYADSEYVQFEYDSSDNQTAYVDEMGNRTEYTHDVLGRLIEEELPDPDGTGPLASPVTQWVYDAMGRVTKIIDPLNRETRYVYNTMGNLSEIRQPDHDGDTSLTVTSFGWDQGNRLTTITDPLGKLTTFGYDELDRRTRQTDPDPDGSSGPLAAPITRWTYDALDRVLTEKDPLLNVMDFSYEDFGLTQRVTQADPDGAGPAGRPLSTAVFSPEGKLLQTISPVGRTIDFTYDGVGQLTKLSESDPTDSNLTLDTSYAYDLAGNLTKVTDAMSNATDYEYDLRNRNTLVRLAQGIEYKFTYFDNGWLKTEIDPLDHETRYQYDAIGRRVTTILPDPNLPTAPPPTATIRYEYDAAGNLTKVTDELDQVTLYGYDLLNHRNQVTQPDPDGPTGPLTAPVTTYVFDGAGQLTSETNPLGQTTSYLYDAMGRLTKITPPNPGSGSPTTEYVYDAASNLTSVKDALGHQTTYGYDKLHRRTSETDANGDATLFGYDAAGQLTSLTDPEDNATLFAYDSVGRMISETNELGDARQYGYDKVGNLTKLTDRNERVTEYEYDSLYRLVEENWMPTSGTTPVRVLSFSYDLDSRMTAASDPSAAYTFAYDNLDRLVLTTHDLAGMSQNVELQESYDARGSRIRLQAKIGTALDFNNAYSYDNIGRLTAVNQGVQVGGNAVARKRVEFSYDAAGRYDEIKRYASTIATNLVAESTFTYDTADRLTGLVHSDGTSTLASYTWTFDQANRIAQLVSTDGTVNYSYDNRDQLTGEDYSYQTDKTYSYDDNGNRTNAGYNTDPNNQLASDGVFDYEYDDEGNRTRRVKITTGESTEYTWDYRNRLTKITERNGSGGVTKVSEYTYDVFDRRVSKSTGPASGPTKVEQYVYDGDHIALQFDGAGNLTHRYLHGPNVDQILADEVVTNPLANGKTYWPLTDNLGTVRDLVSYTTANGATLDNHIKYDAFGNVTSESNAAIDHIFGFTGRERDEESGLHFYRARYYDPAVGKFVSEDPIGFGGGDDNLSRYVNNTATLYFDPNGLAYIDHRERNADDDGQTASSSGTVGSFPGTADDLTLDQIGQLAGSDLYRMEQGPELTGGGRALLIEGIGGNTIWLVPMLGVNANGDTVQNGTFVFDNYSGACDQIKKNHELAWVAAAGQTLRNIAATAEIGTLPGVQDAVTKTAATLAARRARTAIVRVFTSPDPHVASTATRLDALFPGRVIAVNRHLPANVASGAREVDIVMDQFLIQVKGKRGGGLADQIEQCAATLTDKSRRVIGYAPDKYSSHAWKAAANKGIVIARNFDELVAIIKELSR